MDDIKYDAENIFDANRSAVKEAIRSSKELIEIAEDDNPKKLSDINLGYAADILGITPGAADELKKNK